MTIMERGSDTPRDGHGNLQPGLYVWSRDDGWIVQSVEAHGIRGAFAQTIDMALSQLPSRIKGA